MGRTAPPKHTWMFSSRFRAGAFGWRSEPTIVRIKEAVSEIKGSESDRERIERYRPERVFQHNELTECRCMQVK